MADSKKNADRKHVQHAKDGRGDANPDPITGAPGAHPVGTGLGAAGAGAAGAAIGMVGGPIGAAIGGAVGAIVGGLAGKGAGELVNPTFEDETFRTTYTKSSYFEKDRPYDAYKPAYQYGWDSRAKYQGKSFDQSESDLRRGWESSTHAKTLPWDRARGAVRDAFARFDERGEGRIQRKEEEVRVSKERVSAGEVAVHKTVETERVNIPVTTVREEISIERRPAQGASIQGDTRLGAEEIRVPITEEQVRVEKTPVVKEEIVIKKKPVTEKTNVQADLRKEKIDIERHGRGTSDRNPT